MKTNAMRIVELNKNLRLAGLEMIAHILETALKEVPEYGDEISSDEEFKEVILQILGSKCSYQGVGIDNALAIELKSQAILAHSILNPAMTAFVMKTAKVA